MKIVTADDSPTHAGLSRLVEKMGCAVIQAGDGAEAVELYERERPNLAGSAENAQSADNSAPRQNTQRHWAKIWLDNSRNRTARLR